MEVWIGLATVLVGAVATGILTYVNVRARNVGNRRLENLVDTRDLRLPYYQRLFEVSRVITGLPSGETGWRSHPTAARTPLENWYFEQGAGMFLSDEARGRFFDLLRALELAAAQVESGSPLSDDGARDICLLAEQLRYQLTRDMTVEPEPQPDVGSPVATSPPADHASLVPAAGSHQGLPAQRGPA